MTGELLLHPNHPEAQTAAPLPNNIEAEQALLGALLYDNEAFHLLDGIGGPHFYEPLHGRLFDAIARAVGRGGVAEPIVLGQDFADDKAFGEMGGIGYLADLIDRAGPPSQAPHFAAAIVATAQRRELMRLGLEIGATARDPETTPEDAIGQAEAALLALHATDRKVELVSAAQAAARVLEALDAPPDKATGILTGFGPLDEEIGDLLPGNLVLFMGRPSMGKSAAAECVALNIAQQGLGVIQINGEMSPEEMTQRHLTDLCHARWGARGPEYRDIRRRRIGHDQRRMLDQAAAELHPLPLMMLKRPGLKLSQLRSIARRQAAKWARQDVRLGTLIVDHAGLVKPDQTTRDRYADQTLVSNGMKELADELGCPLIVLNQMNRQNESREDKRPQLADLRDSGSWEQDADYVIGWFREAYYAQRQPEPKKELEWATWDAARRSRTIEAIILKARAGACMTVNLWGDVARNAIRGHQPEGDLL